MASGVLNKAEAVAKAIEAGESLKDAAIGLAKEAASSEDVKAVVASAVSAVTGSVATAEKTVEAVTASVASVATVATVEPAAPVTVGIDAPIVIGLLITSPADASQPASVVATAPLPPPEGSAPADEKKDGEKTEAVQDWGASK
jgi:hypothetical protein